MKKIIGKRILLCLMISIIVGLIIIAGIDVFNANQIKQSILFEYNYNNGATVYRDDGWYIDNSGNVVLYSFSFDKSVARLSENYNYLSERELNNIFKSADRKKVEKIGREELYKKYQLMQLVTEHYSKSENTAFDAGSEKYNCYIWDEEKSRYKQILLSEEGDMTTYNLDPAAVELTSWLKVIEENMKEQCEKQMLKRDIVTFLSAVEGGFRLLLNWKVCAGVLSFLFVAYFLTITRLIGGKNSERRVWYKIRETLILSFLLSMLIALLLPIIMYMGHNNSKPYLDALLILEKEYVLEAFLISFVGVTIILFLPLVGRIIADLRSIQVFISGVIIYRVSIFALYKFKNISTSIFPGILEFIGFLAIASIFAILIKLGMAKLAGKYQGTTAENKLHIVGNLLSILGGLIPLFMYINYVCISFLLLLPGSR